MIKNWSRWIFASITDALVTQFNNDGLTPYVEGSIRDLDIESDFIEIRTDGPILRGSNKLWLIDYEVEMWELVSQLYLIISLFSNMVKSLVMMNHCLVV